MSHTGQSRKAKRAGGVKMKTGRAGKRIIEWPAAVPVATKKKKTKGLKHSSSAAWALRELRKHAKEKKRETS